MISEIVGTEPPQPPQAPIEAHLDEWISPQHCDERGHLRAGQILEWMDVVGVLSATRHARRPVVTASVDGVELSEPIHVGERVTMTAQVAHTTARSMGIAVTMTHGVPGTQHRHTLHGWMTFVAVDDQNQCVSVASVMTESAAARARKREGELRREFRKKLATGELWETPPEASPDGDDRRRTVRELLSYLPRLRVPWETYRKPALQKRAREESYMHTIELVRGDSLNAHGTLYGGIAMRWLENNAQLSARAYLGGAAVRCCGLHGLSFIEPAAPDLFVHLRSLVVHADETQVTVLVSVETEEPREGEIRETLRAFLSYVPIEPTTKVSSLLRESEAEHALYREVEHRLALARRLARERAS